MSAAIALVLAAVLSGTAAGPAWAFGPALAATQTCLALRWFSALDVPGERSGAALGVIVAAVADVAVLAQGDHRALAPVVGVLGPLFLVAVGVQLARRDGRPELAESLIAVVSLVIFATIGCGYLGARVGQDGQAVVISSAVAAGVTVLGGSLRLPFGRVAPGEGRERDVRLVVGAAEGLALGVCAAALAGLAPGAGVVIALGAAAAAALGGAFAARVPVPDPVVAAALPLLLAGPMSFVLARVLFG